ncbi:gluconeogenesis factor YvcK family protein [Desmospora profundinema]|uniref:Gluconeogenesis factor n=1 Tax=Desmospora profundinema TaxID=1571184 RepID=A0ABU1INW0_9BACL|nr:YvcK family protein [Desmospora profundinema]MDR6225644.1 putative cofD-like protein [Desmospora profundinema]
MNKRKINGGPIPRIVVIGGGTGLAVMLRGLKQLPVSITAIVTVADDGGSSGRLRSDMGMPPPGDIRNVLVALADTEPMLEKVLQYRFRNGNGLAGHNLGNLFLAAMQDITGDFTHAIREMSRVLAVRGQVLPATGQEVTLHAVMTDGSCVKGESQIPLAGKQIRRVFLEPEDARPIPEALEAIEAADAIVIGPGSLYTSILPNLLVRGMAEAVRASRGRTIYICNVMTQPGETDGYTAFDHLDAIHRHVGDCLIDTIILNKETPPAAILQQYAEEGATMVQPDIKRLQAAGCHVWADNLIQYRTVLRHDAERLSRMILQLAQEYRAGRNSG